MKKKIIISVSVILLVSALITGWVFLKMSKNPDKNGIAPDPSDMRTEFIAEDGDKLTYSPESKTLIAYGETFDVEIDELKNNPSYNDWFEYTEKLVFADGVTENESDFKEFKNVKTVEICSTMKRLDCDTMPPLEKYVVSPESKSLFSDASGVLYGIGYSNYATGTVKEVSLLDVPYNSPLTEFTVPDDVNDWIEMGALNTANLKKVIFGKGVTADVYGALYQLTGIEFYEVHPENKKYSSDEQGIIYSKEKTEILGIPSTVKEFVVPEKATFRGINYDDSEKLNRSVKKITLPNGFYSFTDLLYFANLEEIVISEDNPDYCMSDGVIFTKDMSEIVCYPNTRDGDYYEIPAGVVYIRPNCFTGSKLKKLIISDDVKRVGVHAFRYAEGLESVRIGKSVEEFGMDYMQDGTLIMNPFEYCLNLWEILVDLENPWFCNDFNLALYTKDMKTLLTFPAASRTSPVNVPESVETIHSAFRNCRNVKVINLGKNVTDIFFYTFGEYNNYHAFENCSSLEEINISPDNPRYSSSNGIVYSEDGTQMLLYPQGKTNENLILTECTVPYGAIYKNKHLRTIYVPWEKPEHFVKDGYFGHARYHWIWDFDFPYEIYYVSADGLSYEK